jgi:hypothetical protein
MTTSSSRTSPRTSSSHPPTGRVKGQFENKAKLISAVQALATSALWLDRVNADKGLAKVSNAKLLKLHTALSRAKKDFGSRDKLIGAVLDLGKRGTDEGYKASLAAYPLPRLLDLHDSLSRSSANRATAAKAVAAKTGAAKPAVKRVLRTKKSKQKALAAR